jgi:hypothetical protein
MQDLDTAQLRRMATESARRSQRQTRYALLTIHFFLYLAALAVAFVIVVGAPWVFDTLWSSMDVSAMIFGLFAGWFVGLALHGASVLVDSGWMERQFRQRAAAGVIGRALLDEDDAALSEKAKRLADVPMPVTLSDDGELHTADEEARSVR